MHKAIILSIAKQDIQEAAIWYNSKQKGLGERFTETVRDKVRYICQNPEIASVRYDDTRMVALDIFPFMLHYTVDNKQKAVIISAVFHTSRNPNNWGKRK